jgi:predicted small secreted protein
MKKFITCFAPLALTLMVTLAALLLTGCNVSPMGFGEAAGGKTNSSAEFTNGSARSESNSAFSGIVETTATPKVIIQGDFDSGKALQKMYGNYNSETKRSVWRPKDEELSKFGSLNRTGNLQARVIFSKPFQVGEQTRVFVVTKTAPAREECEDCVPVLGAATFTKVDDQWRLDEQAKTITRTGMHGELNGGKLVKIAPNEYGVLFNWKQTSLGVTEEGALLLAETKAGLKEVFSMILGSNNKAYCQENGLYEDDAECWGYSSKLEFLPNDESNYYDLRVTSEGTKQVDLNETANVRETRRFVYADSGYRQARSRQ